MCVNMCVMVRHMLLEAVMRCSALVGTIIQHERHKCFLPELKKGKRKKKDKT